ncbi:MAG: ABC transporter permease [Cytophagaceae bacterium]|nr:ABC transporter permease [Gemmatimonadaceae bacterium]
MSAANEQSATNMRWAWGLVLALVGVAILAPLVAPFAPDAVDLALRRQGPSALHWFGTDDLGRDVFTRVLHGARVSLAIGLLAAALSVALGTAIGLVAGFIGGAVDTGLMRLTDAMLAVPRLPLLMILTAILQPSIPLLIILVSVVGWMETSRVVRSEALSLGRRGFIEAAQALGLSRTRVLVRHMLPNVLPTVIVSATLAVGRSILLESALSFFGVGVQPPAASWGNMLYQAQSTMTSEPWLALFPGLAIFLTTLAVNAAGERLSTPAVS